jgi:hypothetical protein
MARPIERNIPAMAPKRPPPPRLPPQLPLPQEDDLALGLPPVLPHCPVEQPPGEPEVSALAAGSPQLPVLHGEGGPSPATLVSALERCALRPQVPVGQSAVADISEERAARVTSRDTVLSTVRSGVSRRGQRPSGQSCWPKPSSSRIVERSLALGIVQIPFSQSACAGEASRLRSNRAEIVISPVCQ